MIAVKLETPRFFNRGISPLVSVVFCTLMSIALMTMDSRWNYLAGVRQVLMTGLAPLRQAVLTPLAWLATAAPYLQSKANLAEENEHLQKLQLQMAYQAEELLDLRQENEWLRQLIQLKQRYHGEGVIAEVMYTDRDPFREKIWVHRAESDEAKIKTGYVAIDTLGLVGQITRVYQDLAEITLVTDKDHSTPVKNQRSGARAILFGLGAGASPELRYVAASGDFREGDLLITSGIDGVYPIDLPVAKIGRVDRQAESMFARIVCQPLSQAQKNQHFLILPPAESFQPHPEENLQGKVDKRKQKKL